MRTENLDIRLNRNGDYLEEWQICDLEGNPLNLTGATIQLFVRRVNGQGSVVAMATINPVELIEGAFTVLIKGSDFASYYSGSEVIVFAYDLLLTDTSTSYKTIPVAGKILLTPGATY